AIGTGAFFPIQVQDGGAFAGTTSLAHGANQIHLVARLTDGTRADAIRNVTYNGTPPGIAWVSPSGQLPVGGAQTHVTLQATASNGRTVSSVRVDAGAGMVTAALDAT